MGTESAIGCLVFSLALTFFVSQKFAVVKADFYTDIEDFVQILCRFLHKKMLAGSSAHKYFSSFQLAHFQRVRRQPE